MFWVGIYHRYKFISSDILFVLFGGTFRSAFPYNLSFILFRCHARTIRIDYSVAFNKYIFSSANELYPKDDGQCYLFELLSEP